MSDLDAGVFDVEYAPMGTGWAVRIADLPNFRLDVADYDDIRNLVPSYIASKFSMAHDQIRLNITRVDHLPGRDAPLRIESPSTLQALQLLDEQLEDPAA